MSYSTDVFVDALPMIILGYDDGYQVSSGVSLDMFGFVWGGADIWQNNDPAVSTTWVIDTLWVTNPLSNTYD